MNRLPLSDPQTRIIDMRDSILHSFGAPAKRAGVRIGNRKGSCRLGAPQGQSRRVFLWLGASGGFRARRSRKVRRFSNPVLPDHQLGNCRSGR